MWLLILFIVIPLVEIALFIQVGGFLGLPVTLLIVILTAILGTWLVRTQGIMAIAKLRSSFSELRDPTEPLAHGAMILIAGVVLLTPGFFTDTIGFLLLMPPVRQIVYQRMRSRINIQSFSMGNPTQKQTKAHDSTIDGDFVDITDEKPKNDGPSGWTKH